MVSHGGPGLIFPRKRVGVESGMWVQNDRRACRDLSHDSSMCKVTGARDCETSSVPQSSVKGALESAPDDYKFQLGCEAHEGTRNSMPNTKDGGQRNKQEIAMQALLSDELTPSVSPEVICRVEDYNPAPISEETEGCMSEDAFQHQEMQANETASYNDAQIDMSIEELLSVLSEPTEISRRETKMFSQPVNNAGYPPFDQECLQSTAATLGADSMDYKGILFLQTCKQEHLYSGAQQIDSQQIPFFHTTAQEPSAPFIEGSELELNLSSGVQDSHSRLRDHQTGNQSLSFNLRGQSWQSASSVSCEGAKALERSLRSLDHLATLDCDLGEQASENMVSGNNPRPLGSSLRPVQGIDYARPNQSNGSVLASEANVSGNIATPNTAGVFLAASPTTMPKKRDSRVNVVDLTEDSDEDDTVQYLPHHDQGRLHGKRRIQDGLESDKKKRLNDPGGSFGDRGRVNGQTSRPNFSSPIHLDEWSTLSSFDKNPAADLWRGSDHVPQSWDLSNWSHISPHERLAGAPEKITNRGNSMQLVTMDDPRMKRTLPVSLWGPSTGIRPIHGGQAKENHPGRQQEDVAFGQALLGLINGHNHKDEATPDEGLLSVPLLKHQRLALAWMEKRELSGEAPQGGILADDQGLGKTISTISLILKARAPLRKTMGAIVSSQSGALTVDLDDDADGARVVGRTESLALNVDENHDSRSIQTSGGARQEKTQEDSKSGSSKGRTAAGTLVVCPTSVLRQWAHELKEKVTTKAGLSVLIYHGSSRTRDPDELARYDVVLTTYSIVSMEVPKQPLPEKDDDKKGSGYCDNDLPPAFRGASKAKKPKKAQENGKKNGRNVKGRLIEGENGSADSGPLARVNWFRVILDEAQSIKNARTQVARAAWGLRAKKRWCLSGTPIQNAIDDLYSYFRFLRYHPYDAYKEFREQIKDPVTRTPMEGYKKLQVLLRPVMLRRTKATMIDGEPIVNLPPRIVTLRQTEFNDDERIFYSNLETESRRQFQDYEAAGTLQSNYVNILWMLLRLRQACDHPLLVKGHKSQGAQKVLLDSAKRLPAEQRMNLLRLLDLNREICPICNDLPDDAVICICTHVFCRQCIFEQLAAGDDTCCPLQKCRKPLSTSLVFTLASLRNCEEGSNSSSKLVLDGNQQDNHMDAEELGWKSSSKIDAVIDTLSALPVVQFVVENGRVVVEATQDLQDGKLVDTSGLRIVKQKSNSGEDLEPVSADKWELGSEVKLEPVSGDTVSSAESTNHAFSVKIEKFPSSLTDTVSSSDTVPRYTATGVEAKHELADNLSSQEPGLRQVIESTEKAIVFSQWTSMLDLLEVKLKQAKFNYRRLDGTMSVLARDRAVSEFKALPEVTVIIMSLKAASLGLNMVAACHVLLLDVWWNPTTEDQAIDRAHRIGQTRTVKVSRFTVKNTIEDRILDLQEKKRQIVASAFGETDGGGQKSRLTMEDLQFLFS